MYNRRNFLKLGGLTMAGSLVIGNINISGQTAGKSGYFSLPSKTLSENINLFDRQTFEPFINTTFTVGRKNSPAISLRLVEIVSSNYKQNPLTRTPVNSFSLIFEVAGRGALKDEICEMSHPELGELSIFVSTVGSSGKRYQAIFSRVHF